MHRTKEEGKRERERGKDGAGEGWRYTQVCASIHTKHTSYKGGFTALIYVTGSG